MEHIGLFEGIGGFSLAASWLGWKTVAQCEIDKFCQEVLKYHFPESKLYEDIKKTDFNIWRGKVNILTGGFPCQPFSHAGSRKGADDDRYLWPEMLRAVNEIRPTWFVGENVTGIGSMVFEHKETNLETQECIDGQRISLSMEADGLLLRISKDLEDIGYKVQVFNIPACALDAPHERQRIWIVAHSDQFGIEFGTADSRRKKEDKTLRSKVFFKTNRFSSQQSIANSSSNRRIWKRKGIKNEDRKKKPKTARQLEGRFKRFRIFKAITYSNGINGFNISRYESCRRKEIEKNTKVTNTCCNEFAANPSSFRQWQKGDWIGKTGFSDKKSQRNDWKDFPTQSPICDGNDGIPSKLDGITFSKLRKESIKAGGNAIVPQVFYEIGLMINEIEKNFKNGLH